MPLLRILTAQFLHQGAHALVLDHTGISHWWAKDLPTVTHRGNVAGIHDALGGACCTSRLPLPYLGMSDDHT
ncbi:hypothetical protein [Streptomyces coeruleofuscus]|uniref:Uncharacterized protein n=1 Tax=Streptomyces coeruleofuscus TaxID=66879 RepID=A0ABN3JDD6_9ACTN